MYSKKTYLVDTENIGSTWKVLLPDKQTKDQIILFYTENSPNISYTDLQDIIKYPDSFELIKCNTGRNGLDFQLVSYLGFLLKSSPKTDYIILSNDSGYDPACTFWSEKGYSVSRVNMNSLAPSASQTTTKKAKPTVKLHTVKTKNTDKNKVKEASKPKTITTILSSCLPDTYAKQKNLVNEIAAIITQNDVSQLQPMHSAFVAKYGDKEGTVLYKAVKPFFKEMTC